MHRLGSGALKLRYTPLKRTPGPRAKENQRMRAKVWPAVLRRDGFKCAVCGALGVQLVGHHVAGRPGSGLCLGEWANSEELLTALCEGCHREAHVGAGQLREKLMRQGGSRLFYRRPEPRPVIAQFSPQERIRELVRQLEALGLRPDGREKDD